MLAVYLIISAVIVGLDQWTKYLTVENIQLGETKEFISGFLSFTYIRNTGGAWSILEGKMMFFYIMTVVVVAVLLYMLVKNIKNSKWFTIGLSLILAGALGNFIDRLRLGYVVDMFKTEFINFPIFNVADMALVIGVACVFIYLILDERKEKKAKA
ncbi:signal peptidase II [Candidatus Enterococcus clewellii]|uniref:Lipoprotein signal peptidase n=1 Tax=Candidatus Enterococcus clewellii TaxID=1834193 RepID=A0A242KCE6_9ENTE|nr:signal peptidase II [Enterococcus sp. 9E7_DIV0242]OTP18458.1 signal peptidase II [Enterococcus sp. 9E7_DIV0242]